jgi:hypothetical protein
LFGKIDEKRGPRKKRRANERKISDEHERLHPACRTYAGLIERIENITFSPEVAMFFEFPEDARWNDESDCVEFLVLLRPYEGTARIARRVFQGLLDQSPTPERCMEAFHLQRTRFEMIVERKLRRRQLTDDGNVEITGRDLREKTPPVGQGSLLETGGARVL